MANGDPTPVPSIEIDDGETVWRFPTGFLQSRWTCIWGAGCVGILDHPAPELGHGCCSVGAELDDGDEAMTIGALAAALDPARFQFHAEAAAGGIYADDDRRATRVVDGACVFLNRPGFTGGAGCALHLGALDADEAPTDWKPSVCWQLPLHIDWAPTADGRETATMRPWNRTDWGSEGTTMAWCCTEGELAYVGDVPVVESLSAELTALVGPAVYVELRQRLSSSPENDDDP